MWEWMIAQGLIQAEEGYYESGKATQEEMKHAIEVAYKASSGDVRKQLVDHLWATGKFEGTKEYWYLDRTGQVTDLGNAAKALSTRIDPVGGPDHTTSEDTRFNGLPGTPEIWHEEDTGKVYAVYYVPNSNPPIPLLYHVPNEEDLESFFGDSKVAYDRNISTKDIDSFGSIRWGTTDDIPATEGDPWVGFVDKFDRAKETQPWLNDPEVFATFTAAWLEGREPEQWELESTDWWQDHSESQREWMWLSARNPAEAAQVKLDNYTKTYNAFVELGISNPSTGLVEYMSNEFTKGDWTSTYLANQIDAIYNPDMADAVDGDLAKFMTGSNIDIGDPALGTSDVKAMWDKWLGPAYPPTEDQINTWSARIRKGGAGAQDQLTEHLRSQRMAMYPEYADSSLSYDDIASPWRGFATNSWGTTMDETSDTFQQLVKLNDTVEGGKLLRKEGMRQGIGQVQESAAAGLFSQTSGIRRAV